MLHAMFGQSQVVRRGRIFRAGIRAFVSLCIAVLALFITSCQRYTPDDDLVHLLSVHEPEFHELLEMAKADTDIATITPRSLLVHGKLLFWDRDREEIARVMSAPRWFRYQELFRKAGIDGGMFKEPDGAVEFEIDRPSFRNGDSRKGIAFGPKRPEPELPSLNGLTFGDVSKLAPHSRTVYKLVKDSWYLYLYFNS